MGEKQAVCISLGVIVGVAVAFACALIGVGLTGNKQVAQAMGGAGWLFCIAFAAQRAGLFKP